MAKSDDIKKFMIFDEGEMKETEIEMTIKDGLFLKMMEQILFELKRLNRK